MNISKLLVVMVALTSFTSCGLDGPGKMSASAHEYHNPEIPPRYTELRETPEGFRIQAERVGNADVMIFHVSSMLVEEHRHYRTPSAVDSIRYLEQTPLVKQLFEIQGVKEVRLKPYEVTIERSHVFGWEELQPQIEEVIVSHPDHP